MDVAGGVVCVTGAGGYIGAALVAALLPVKPRSIILLDSSEGNLFEARRKFAGCEYVLGSVTDSALLNTIFGRLQPRIVYHAAAYKHVGLLETAPFAAIKNNTLGTDTLVRAALAHGISKLVLVSTDKAANPHSIMGVSKRIAERIALSFNGTNFQTSAIRLGNVMGSPGSVVPIFEQQIASSQPLSITHPQAARYFMSRAEAVTAILAAGAVDIGGMILLPELKAPVRIADLARSLTDKQPLCFSELGPGEKLIEDLIGANETLVGTFDGPLKVIRTPLFSKSELDKARGDLAACVARHDRTRLLSTLCRLVPEYRPSDLMRASGHAL